MVQRGYRVEAGQDFAASSCAGQLARRRCSRVELREVFVYKMAPKMMMVVDGTRQALLG